MTFTPAVAEQRLVLEHIAGIGELGVDGDILEAVLECAFAAVNGRRSTGRATRSARSGPPMAW